MSAALGYQPLTDSAWGLMEELWWKFHSDTPELEEMSKLVWNFIPQISTTPILCKISLVCEEDAGKSGNCNNFYGQSACNKAVASVSTHQEI